MSYILDALKKSQEERELGQVPTLSSGPYLSAERPAKVNPWSLAAVGLAALAVLIALYAALAPRLAEPPTSAPPLAAMGPQGEAKPPPGEAPAAATPPPTTAPEPAVAKTEAPPAGPGEPPPILDETALQEQVERFEAEQGPPPPRRQEPRPPPSAFAPGSGRPPQVPADLRRDILEFKQKALREAGKKERPAPSVATAPPVREPTERVVVPPPAAKAPAPPVAAPAPAPAVGERTLAPPPGPPGTQAPAGPEGSGKLPQARLTVHVFAEEPAKRFVILNSQRVREGDQTSEGLLVEEIRPDGVTLSFQGQRFFRAR